MTLDEYLDYIGSFKSREEYRARLMRTMLCEPVQVIRMRDDASDSEVINWLRDNLNHKFHVVRHVGYVMFESMDDALMFKLVWG